MSITDQGQTFVAVTEEGVKATHTHVILDDAEFVVRTGQTRDLIAWDQLMARKFDRTTQLFVFTAFLTYRAAVREGFFGGDFDSFVAQLVDLTPVRPADEPALPAGEPVPPTTRTAPPA